MMRLLFLAALALPATASAGGYYLTDSGVVPMARGGAFVAGADTQFAQYYNPAGLMNIKRPTFNIGVSGVYQGVSFDSLNDDGTFEDTVNNLGGVFPIPQLGFVTPINDKFTFAFGFISPFAPDYKYAEGLPTRYVLIDSTVVQFGFSPSIAWQPIKQLKIGASFQWQMLLVGQSLAVTTSGLRAESGDVLVDLSAADMFSPSFNAGIIYEPTEQIAIGASVQPPVSFSAKGTGVLDFSGNALEAGLDQPVWEDDEININVTLPMILRTGVAVRPNDKTEIELGFTWEGWASLKQLQLSGLDVALSGPLIAEGTELPETVDLPAGLSDVWSVRLGGDYRLADPLELRAGVMYEKGSLGPENVSISLVDVSKVRFGGGGSAFFGANERLRLDFSGAYVVLPTGLEIRDSDVEQVRVYGNVDQTSVVGNGDLSSHGWMVGVQTQIAFGKLP